MIPDIISENKCYKKNVQIKYLIKHSVNNASYVLYVIKILSTVMY